MSIASKWNIKRPFVQNFIVGSTVFCLHGIFSALLSLGAGGGADTSADIVNKTSAIIVALFTTCGIVGGPLLNILRPKRSLMIGSIGFPLLAGGCWYYDRTGKSWFPLLSGVIMGLTCNLTFTVSSYVQYSYPEEKDKASYIGIQTAMRSLGAVIGSAIPLSFSINQASSVSSSTAVYVTFIVIHASAFFIAMVFVIDPKDVVREDGTHIAIFKPAKPMAQLKGMVNLMRRRKYLLMIPSQMSCGVPTALAGSINSRYFNLRTRSVNSIAYQAAQFIFPVILLFILDSKYIKSRRTRGLLGVAFMGAVTLAATAGLIGWLLVNRVDSLTEAASKDWLDSEWAGSLVCYVLFGAIYSGHHMVAEYTMSATTNEPDALAHVAGISRFFLGLGLIISFFMASERVSFVAQAALQIVLLGLGIIGIVWVLLFYVKDTNYFAEENVIVPMAIREKMKGTEAAQVSHIEERASQDSLSDHTTKL